MKQAVSRFLLAITCINMVLICFTVHADSEAVRLLESYKKSKKKPQKPKKGEASSLADFLVNSVFFGSIAGLLYYNRESIAFGTGAGSLYLDERVRVGRSRCYGRLRRLRCSDDRTVALIQLRVPRQNGAVCGYRALLQTLLIMDSLQRNRTGLADRIENEDTANAFVDLYRPVVQEYRQRHVTPDEGTINRQWFINGDYVDDEELRLLLTQEEVNNSVTGPLFTRDQVTVVSRPSDVGLPLSDPGHVRDTLSPIIRQLQEEVDGIEDGRIIHGIVLRQGDEGNGGKAGHWVSVVLDQRGERQRIYCADSVNGRLLQNDGYVQRIVGVLAGPEAARAYENN